MKKQYELTPEKMLQKAKLPCTRGRVAILKVLSAARNPLTREQIASKLGEKSLNKVTIYRALERFVQAGLVHKAYMHKRAWHFELSNNCTRSQCHPHFTCKNCGETHCLVELSFPIVKDLRKGFVVHRQQVRLEGLCPACG